MYFIYTSIISIGATTKELMRRVGHSSANAALRYQHATEDRDAAIAQAMSGLAAQAVGDPISESLAGYSREMDRLQKDTKKITGPLTCDDDWQSQRDSNPCLHLERVMS